MTRFGRLISHFGQNHGSKNYAQYIDGYQIATLDQSHRNQHPSKNSRYFVMLREEAMPSARYTAFDEIVPKDTNKRSKAIVFSPSCIAQEIEEGFEDPECGHGLTWKTLISASKSFSHEMTSGIARCAPSTGHLCVHQHLQAELYHFISGNGIVTVDGVESWVEAGSVVFIPGDVKHGVRNTDETNELVWLYVFAADDFMDIKYRFPHMEARYTE